jgi:hypothetical protein
MRPPPGDPGTPTGGGGIRGVGRSRLPLHVVSSTNPAHPREGSVSPEPSPPPSPREANGDRVDPVVRGVRPW